MDRKVLLAGKDQVTGSRMALFLTPPDDYVISRRRSTWELIKHDIRARNYEETIKYALIMSVKQFEIPRVQQYLHMFLKYVSC